MVQKRQTYTIRDIAQQANVSYQTVSLVINNKPGVSDATRKRILALMDELDYHPNRVAQILNSNQSRTLELIIVDVQYGGRLADSTKIMAATAKDMGYSLLISEAESRTLAAAFSNAAARRVDGVVLYAPRLRFSITGCLVCRGAEASQPACAYYAATFERLFRKLVHRGANVVESRCEACGDSSCEFDIRW